MTTAVPAAPSDPLERHTAHVDALLTDISRTAEDPRLRYVGWVARRHGSEVAAELERRRRAQYGFCGAGHPRRVRARCDERGRYRAHTPYCPTCEGC